MEVLYEKHIAIRQKPKNLKDADLLLFSHEFSKSINETNLLTLQEADIFDNIVFSKRKFNIYSRYSCLNKISEKQRLKLLLSLIEPCEKIDGGIWITDNLSLNYFHWLTDALPRLVASEKFLNKHSILLPDEYKKMPYILQSLNVLNCNTTFFNSQKRLHVKNLLLPGHTAPRGNYNKEIINIVRSKFLSENKKTVNKKIYISRQKALRRKIINEEAVINLLSQYDFEIHFFEDYDFYKQIELAKQTTHLISLHGAGLTNMLFMHEKGKILELRNEGDSHNNCYFSLASDLGHDYYYLLSKGDKPDTTVANLTIDITDLKNVIDQILI